MMVDHFHEQVIAKGKIGGGRHERFIIQNEKFQAKANKKAEQ